MLVIALVGNKADLYLSQEVTEQEQRKFAEDNNFLNFRISCTEEEGVKEMLTKLGKAYLAKKSEVQQTKGIATNIEVEQTKGIKLNCKEHKKRKHSCCLISLFSKDEINERKSTRTTTAEGL